MESKFLLKIILVLLNFLLYFGLWYFVKFLICLNIFKVHEIYNKIILRQTLKKFIYYAKLF